MTTPEPIVPDAPNEAIRTNKMLARIVQLLEELLAKMPVA